MRSGVTLDGNEHRSTGEATKKASVCQQSERKPNRFPFLLFQIKKLGFEHNKKEKKKYAQKMHFMKTFKKIYTITSRLVKINFK
ncbi:hypothetical protein AN960_19785 [Bacillus sp. FJAT-25509]|nr:hypothetical protein AN960_19785 [Bacillus sp. FJAT-25509]